MQGCPAVQSYWKIVVLIVWANKLMVMRIMITVLCTLYTSWFVRRPSLVQTLASSHHTDADIAADYSWSRLSRSCCSPYTCMLPLPISRHISAQHNKDFSRIGVLPVGVVYTHVMVLATVLLYVYRPANSQLSVAAFPVAVAKIWKALPDDVVSASSVDSCRHQLKTFLNSSDSSAVSTSVDLAVFLPVLKLLL